MPERKYVDAEGNEWSGKLITDKNHQQRLIDLFKEMGEPLTFIGNKVVFHSHTLTFDEFGTYLRGTNK